MVNIQNEQFNEQAAEAITELFGQISEMSLDSDKFTLTQDLWALEPSLKRVLSIITNIKKS